MAESKESFEYFIPHSGSPWREVPWDVIDESGEQLPQYLREGPLPPPVGWLLHDYPHPEAPDSAFIPKPLRPVRVWSGEDAEHYDDSQLLRETGFGGRYGQKDYFRHRENTERWLWRHAVYRLGMPLETEQPVYFRYTEEFLPVLEGTGRRTLGIAMPWLPTNQMTFTLYDSFHNFAKYIGEPFENTPDDLVPLVLTWREISELLKDQRAREIFTNDRSGPYIECQFWDRNHDLIRILSGAKYE